jgi:hypothetical protein
MELDLTRTGPTSPPRPAARGRADVLAWFGGASLILSLAAIAWFFALLVRDVEAADFTDLDTARSRVAVGPGWYDPRWEQALARRLAQVPELAADSPEARAQVEAALLELPFVAEVGATRVLWPDGLQVEVKLRPPIACVRTGELFLPVGEDGVVLLGAWSSPPSRGTGFLPLVALEEGAREAVFEGAQLATPAAVDGLAVARALAGELGGDDWIRLGRCVIDARRAREATVEVPGVVLWLEGGRRVYFGRSPNLDAPGELPFATKCASLARALRLFDAGSAGGAGAVDWELADVRWDRPEILPRGGIDDPRSGRAAFR